MTVDQYEMSNTGTSKIAPFDVTPEPGSSTGFHFNTRKNKSKEGYSVHHLAWQWPLFMLTLGCVIYYTIYYMDYSLPKVPTEDESLINPDLFSAIRAQKFLRNLTSIGPRVFGTPENQLMAPNIIMAELEDIKKNANPAQKFEYELQRGDGAYPLQTKTPFVNMFQDVQNVIGILYGSVGSYGIVMNCHFDTVPTSQGGSDDGISCAVMTELARVLAASPKRLTHNVVFLFNGCEEVSLEGSYLFLQHRWSKNVKVVLNMDAAGLGGKSILFQAGPKHSWLMKYYTKAVPHPSALIAGEELFQNGIIPSDTDFRIFRDFGNMIGYDFAFSRNGYVYHTPFDSEKYIPLGSYQHLGDNSLALLKALGHAPELANLEKNQDGQMVYYDYLGWFIVSYSTGTSLAFNILALLLGIGAIAIFIGRLSQWRWLPQGPGPFGKIDEGEIFGKKMKMPKFVQRFKSKKSQPIGVDSMYVHVADQKQNGNVSFPNDGRAQALIEFSFALGGHMAGLLLGIVCNVIMAVFIDGVASLVMPWYSNVWIIFPFYWCPYLAAHITVVLLVNHWRSGKRKLSTSLTAQLNIAAHLSIWLIILFVLICTGIRSTCLLVPLIFFTSISFYILYLTPLYLTVHKWLWVYLLFQIPSFIFSLYLTLMLYTLFVPIMGRSGNVNGDLYIGILSAGIVFFNLSFAIPLMSLVRKPKFTIAFLVIFALIMLPIALPTRIGHPYSGNADSPTPQRYWIVHSDRQFFDESQQLRKRQTGYFILNQDRNSPKTIPLRGRSLNSLTLDCEEELFCGLPYYRTRMVPLGPKSSWIPAGAPDIPENTTIRFENKTCTENSCILELTLLGPDRMTFTFSPREGVELESWTIPSTIVRSGTFKGRPSYFVFIVRGKVYERPTYPVTLTFKGTNGKTPMVDLGLSGNFAHHDAYRTPEYSSFLKSMPHFTQTASWIGAYVTKVF